MQAIRQCDGKRAVKAWIFNRAVAVFAAALLSLTPQAAEAGFTKVKEISTGKRITLEDKTLYKIDSNEIVVTAGSGLNAYEVSPNATAVLYIPEGSTLTLNGGAASSTSGAGAGIEVPESATLIITGAGTLEAKGGQGGSGSNGENGQDAHVDCDDDHGRAGYGGAGGAGGGGAGAGIGGKGGAGGSGGARCSGQASQYKKTDHGDYDQKAIDGNYGKAGSAGKPSGTIYVLGSVKVTGTGGAQGASGGSVGSAGSFDRDYYWYGYSYRGGGGGGGGGGGKGASPANGIGGGGGGGGGGGSGGEGARYCTTQGYTSREATGGQGGGGTADGGGTRSQGEKAWYVGRGGWGGHGGGRGGTGSSGKVYKSTSSTVSGAASTSAAESHSAIEYKITFDNDWHGSEQQTAKFGFAPPGAPVATRYGYTFGGWYTGNNGTGTQYYDANGNSVNALWLTANDVTLYPKWVRNEHESLDDIKLTVRNITASESAKTVVDGMDASGSGWSYSKKTGRLVITGADCTYDISGKDMLGFAPIFANAANCTIRISKPLEMEPGDREGYNPITVMSGVSATVEVSALLADELQCFLTGAPGRTAIYVQTGATLTLKTGGWLCVDGGEGAADIGINKDETSCGDIYVETYNRWFARIRPWNDYGENDWLLNNIGKSAKFISAVTDETVWSVRISGLDEGPLYLQRIEGDFHDFVQPSIDHYAWFWLPKGGYEWGTKLNASLSDGDTLWVCYVEEQHSVATGYHPLHIEIDGEDIAHLNGNGWYAELSGSDGSIVDGTKASLVITNAGPHVITGYGNAGIDIGCDCELTISDLKLDVADWRNKTPLWLANGVTLDLTIEGENRLIGGADSPGIAVCKTRTLNIVGGSGTLMAQGGKNAAGIGGSYSQKESGTINIKGGTIMAIGGSNAAGIGGAQTTSQSGDINISGGIIAAYGGQYGAGIGGGYTGYANVNITGGTVYPVAGNNANAIGTGYKGGDVVPVKNTFGWAAIYDTKYDKVWPRAVNSGNEPVFPVTFDMGLVECQVTNVVIDKVSKPCVDLWTNERGSLVLWLASTGSELHTITITATDGDTDVKKSWGYKVDDNGDYSFSRDVITVDGEPVVGGMDNGGDGWDYTSGNGIIMFRSGSHEISGNSTNGTIRVVSNGPDVHITLNKLMLETSKSYLSPFVVSNSCTITLVGDSIIECIHNPAAQYANDFGSRYTAAIEVPEGSSLTINGEGTLTANGGIWGAGIGSRGNCLNAGSIRIDGGYIYAQGGSHNKQIGGGAGIGGGDGGGVASILVTGGYVDATGGRGACGIGGGARRGVTLTDGTFRVTGGTVLAAKGSPEVFSDFVTGTGNTIAPTMGKSIVIDGPCSVRPKNTVVANANPYPTPVNSNGVALVFAMIGGLGPGDAVQLVDNLWPQYNGRDILADDGGAVCIWGEYTNVVRTIQIESPNTPGGQMPFELSAASNTIYYVSDDYEAPDSRKIDDKDCWRVEVKALPARKRLPVEGIERPYSRGTTVSDSTGMTYLYLPDGEYDFTVGGYSYHASVSGMPTVATFTVGIFVDGVDIGECSGEGWAYNGTDETLRLNRATTYVISGTNNERRVSISAETTGVTIRSDRLMLTAADHGGLYSDTGSLFEYAGGTIGTGIIPSRMIVSGGSLDAVVANPVARSENGEFVRAYRVTVGGLTRYAKIEISDVEGLVSYDTEAIYANSDGEIYLYLPDGDYWFGVSDGRVSKEVVAIVEGGDAKAFDFIPTGVYINGREAARLRGLDDDGNVLWRNIDGLVHLLAPTNYVLSGTNDGAEIVFNAEQTLTTLVLDNLVMTNAYMNASPISIGNDGKSSFAIELVGTNILHAADNGGCGVEMLQQTELSFAGEGRLEAHGVGPGIGMGQGTVSDGSSVIVHSGEIVAVGGDGAAGIGGGSGQAGVKTYIYGGKVTATGGDNAAGIGGGRSMEGSLVVITNGVVTAVGGVGGAGIGGGQGGAGNIGSDVCEIAGGIVTARGGEDAAGIGGGSGGASGRYRQRGGTVVARGVGGNSDIGPGSSGSTASASYAIILGGSLDSYSDRLSPTAKNASDALLYCVTVPTSRPNFDIGAVVSDFNGYSLNGVVTDDEGKIYIWLPNGEYYINIGSRPFRAFVDGADTVAEEWYVGVEVNGEDVALQSGAGWTYGVYSKILNVFNDGCTVSGTNTAGDVYLQYTNDVSSVVSNLLISTVLSSTESPVSIVSNANVKLSIVGENAFASGAESCAGVNVPHGSTLSITNLDMVAAMPDLDNIAVITNILYDIEYDDDGNPMIDPDTGCVITNGIIYDIYVETNYVDKVVVGALSAKGGGRGAGIGGGNLQSHGTIEIFGGVIDASGNGSFCAGIGSGRFPDSGEGFADAETLRQGVIRIRGGEVKAKGGSYGAAIGGGNRHSGGVIEISGGLVNANGGDYASGIGGGWGARGHTITISGGEVNATGGTGAAAIGGGSESSKSLANTEISQISISGGRVTAIATGMGGAGIGNGKYDSESAAVDISGGTVVATAGALIHGYNEPCDIGIGACSSSDCNLHDLAIMGASVHATNRETGHERVLPAPSNGVERVYCVTVETSKTNEIVRIENLSGFDVGDDEVSSIYADADGKIYLWLPNGTYIFYVDNQPRTATVNNADTTAGLWQTGVMIDGVDAAYREVGGQMWYYDMGKKLLHIGGDHVVSGTNTTGYVRILAGPYEGAESTGGGSEAMSFTISNLYIRTSSVSPLTTTNGTVTVRLAGANVLDASRSYDDAALFVMPDTAVVITNVEETASLTARGGEDAAGIGGSRDWSAGRILISGGTVTATGGVNGAGIGSAYRESVRGVVVSGGTVTATGGSEGGAGIGGGFRGSFDEISISGGVVDATGGAEGGAGIGGGCKGEVGSIAISGGRVTAIGGADRDFSVFAGAGIGGGDSGEYRIGDAIGISGGTIFARGGLYATSYGADIGLGMSPKTGYAGYKVVMSGSSTLPYFNQFDESSDNKSVIPVNGAGQRVYRVVLSDFTPNTKVEMEMSGYGTNDIYADVTGRIFLWLADGEHYYSAGGRRYATKIEGGTVTTIGIPDSYGVELDGVDVANLSGEGWSYKLFQSRLDVTKGFVISGTNTEGKVNIFVDAADETALTISNLCLKATSGSPITILHGTNTLCLAGTNTLDAADAAGYPGLHVAGMHQGVVVTNLHDGAKLVARGGANAAGIGAGNSDYTGSITIAGGIVEAAGGAEGAGIGSSKDYGFYSIAVAGGTVIPTAGSGSKAIGCGSSCSSYITEEKITFTGGSIEATADMVSGAQFYYTRPKNAAGDYLYPVTLPGFTPNGKVEMEIDGYNTDGIYADGEGKIHVWLAEDDYIFILGGVPHIARVTSSGAVAEPWLSGVTVDGTDAAYLHDESGKWRYTASDRRLSILSGTSPDDCVTVTGTNTESYVHVFAESGTYFAISNLCIASSNAAPVSVSAQSATATVAFAGTNTLDATQARDRAGLQAESYSYLSLTNLEESAVLVANGGSGGAGIGGGWCNPNSVNGVYVNIYGGNVTATGGMNASGIGGGGNGNGEVNIYGGDIRATGGSNGTGIGSGSGHTGRVNIWGGFVDATSGSGSSAGIGGGYSSYAYVYIYGGLVKAESRGSGMAIGAGSYSMGYVYISGGTVVPKPYTYATSKSIGSTRDGFGEVRFTGGSISTTTSLVSPAPGDNGGDAVWPVTVKGLKARSKMYVDGLPSYYGTKDIYSDEAGEITLWLPNGDYDFTATDEDDTVIEFLATVADAAASASRFARTGFTVNGQEVAFGSGEGWSYNDGAVNGGITLSGLDHYVLSGSLTNKYLNICNSCSVVFSNVVFNSFNVDTQNGVVWIKGAYDVELTIEGVNMVKAPTGGSLAAIRVPDGAALAIGGGGSLDCAAGPYAAGIGGGHNSDCGAITINGGIVMATGGNYGAGIGGGSGAVKAGTIRINGGVVTATGGSYAAGIGGGGSNSEGSVEITGGRVEAVAGSGGGACIGAGGEGGAYGGVTISGGTVVAPTDETWTHAIGNSWSATSVGPVTITGGSINANPDHVDPAPSNGTARVSRVVVDGLTPGAAVAFDGLPEYYGKSGIYADADGKAYLWLPEDWTTPVAPKLFAAAPKKGLLGASSGTSHKFAANGYSYMVTIDSSAGGAVAEKGDPLQIESLKVDGFAVEDGWLVISVTASPATWLYGFADTLKIRASETLPIPDTDDALLDLSEAELWLSGDDKATIAVPLREGFGDKFFKMEAK